MEIEDLAVLWTDLAFFDDEERAPAAPPPLSPPPPASTPPPSPKPPNPQVPVRGTRIQRSDTMQRRKAVMLTALLLLLPGRRGRQPKALAATTMATTRPTRLPTNPPPQRPPQQTPQQRPPPRRPPPSPHRLPPPPQQTPPLTSLSRATGK
ncbi:atherin-like [Harpegnathos saltator]|uniref:atherin-like n=1 Tax=Harpegnathos saltator TaxID=610380 RepID=UPI000DBEE917|nr:atherin-like [Harpegnathos saltator]